MYGYCAVEHSNNHYPEYMHLDFSIRVDQAHLWMKNVPPVCAWKAQSDCNHPTKYLTQNIRRQVSIFH